MQIVDVADQFTDTSDSNFPKLKLLLEKNRFRVFYKYLGHAHGVLTDTGVAMRKYVSKHESKKACK